MTTYVVVELDNASDAMIVVDGLDEKFKKFTVTNDLTGFVAEKFNLGFFARGEENAVQTMTDIGSTEYAGIEEVGREFDSLTPWVDESMSSHFENMNAENLNVSIHPNLMVPLSDSLIIDNDATHPDNVFVDPVAIQASNIENIDCSVASNDDATHPDNVFVDPVAIQATNIENIDYGVASNDSATHPENVFVDPVAIQATNSENIDYGVASNDDATHPDNVYVDPVVNQGTEIENSVYGVASNDDATHPDNVFVDPIAIHATNLENIDYSVALNDSFENLHNTENMSFWFTPPLSNGNNDEEIIDVVGVDEDAMRPLGRVLLDPFDGVVETISDNQSLAGDGTPYVEQEYNWDQDMIDVSDFLEDIINSVAGEYPVALERIPIDSNEYVNNSDQHIPYNVRRRAATEYTIRCKPFFIEVDDIFGGCAIEVEDIAWNMGFVDNSSDFEDIPSSDIAGPSEPLRKRAKVEPNTSRKWRTFSNDSDADYECDMDTEEENDDVERRKSGRNGKKTSKEIKEEEVWKCRKCGSKFQKRPEFDGSNHAMKYLDFMRYKCTEMDCEFAAQQSHIVRAHFVKEHPESDERKKFEEVLTEEQKSKLDEMVAICFPDFK